MKVVWRAEAREDWRRLRDWLGKRNKVAALRLSTALLAAADRLVDLPEKGRPGVVVGTRELSTVPPYIIVYQVDHAAGLVRIVRIWHSAQSRA